MGSLHSVTTAQQPDQKWQQPCWAAGKAHKNAGNQATNQKVCLGTPQPVSWLPFSGRRPPSFHCCRINKLAAMPAHRLEASFRSALHITRAAGQSAQTNQLQPKIGGKPPHQIHRFIRARQRRTSGPHQRPTYITPGTARLQSTTSQPSPNYTFCTCKHAVRYNKKLDTGYNSQSHS